jgi:hypothetical protein
VLDVGKAASATCTCCGLGQSFTVISVITREQALAAGDERQEIVAGAVLRLAAEFDDLSRISTPRTRARCVPSSHI